MIRLPLSDTKQKATLGWLFCFVTGGEKQAACAACAGDSKGWAYLAQPSPNRPIATAVRWRADRRRAQRKKFLPVLFHPINSFAVGLIFMPTLTKNATDHPVIHRPNKLGRQKTDDVIFKVYRYAEWSAWARRPDAATMALVRPVPASASARSPTGFNDIDALRTRSAAAKISHK